jgi:hypothetical protein
MERIRSSARYDALAGWPRPQPKQHAALAKGVSVAQQLSWATQALSLSGSKQPIPLIDADVSPCKISRGWPLAILVEGRCCVNRKAMIRRESHLRPMVHQSAYGVDAE